MAFWVKVLGQTTAVVDDFHENSAVDLPAAVDPNSPCLTVRGGMFNGVRDHFGKNLSDRKQLIERQSASAFEVLRNDEAVGGAKFEGVAYVPQMLPQIHKLLRSVSGEEPVEACHSFNVNADILKQEAHLVPSGLGRLLRQGYSLQMHITRQHREVIRNPMIRLQ